MDIPDDPRDLTGMSSPVPHYRDIRRADDHPLDKALATAVNVGTVLGVITWIAWGAHTIWGWLA